MQKIIPHLWFSTEAKESAAFYVSAFGATGLPQAGGDTAVTHASVSSWIAGACGEHTATASMERSSQGKKERASMVDDGRKERIISRAA